MTEELRKMDMQAEAIPRPRPLTDEEVEEVRLWMRQQEQNKNREALRQQQAAAEREGMLNQPRFRGGQPVMGALGSVQLGHSEYIKAWPKLPSGWTNGFKTSEFWTAVAGVVLAIAKGYGYNIPEDAFWGIVVYILGRSGMKSAAAFRSGVKQ